MSDLRLTDAAAEQCKPMHQRRDVNLTEAAAQLVMPRAELKKWLAKHPMDQFGDVFYLGRGSGRTFTTHDVGRIALAMIRQQAGAEFSDAYEPIRSDGWIYFIEGGDWIKIGFTRNGRERFKKMATDAPVELRFLHAEPGTFKQEKVLHREFADLRTRGEWFRRDARIFAHIEQRKLIVGDLLAEMSE